MRNLEIRRLLFLGTLQRRADCRAAPACSEAANNFQRNLLEALIRCGIDQVVALSLLPMARSTRRPVFVGGHRSCLDEYLTLWRAPFVNLGWCKPLTAFFSFVGATLAMWLGQKWRPDAILIYDPILRYTLPGLLAARLWGVPGVLIVADLNPVIPWKLDRSFMRQVRTRLRARVLHHFDGLIVLSGHVAGDYGAGKPTLKMEGGITGELAEIPPQLPGDDHWTLMYSGSLNESSGARLALAAFTFLDDPRYRLWFTGRGPLEGQIRTAARADPRIRCYGFVDRAAYLALAAQATVLLNPRLGWPENRYNFPSKLLEYLASGRPVITTSTSDLEAEYGDKVFVLREQTPQALAALIEDVCGMVRSDLDAVGARARAYMLAHKTWAAQGQRVYEFIAGLPHRRGKG